MSLKTIETVRFYDYSVDRIRWVIQWQEQPIALSRKSFDLLLYLIDHRDRVVSKDELLEKLWQGQFVEVSICIYRAKHDGPGYVDNDEA